MIYIAHLVKCVICGEQFDRDKVQAVKISARRYAHHRCKPDGELVAMEEKPPADPDLLALEEYIKKLFNIDFINPRIRKQINEYHQNLGFSYSGMLKTLYWFFEIQNNPIDKANGSIGIIPWAYQSARDYYKIIYQAQQANKEKDIKNYKPKVIQMKMASPRREKPKIKLFNIDFLED